jgi:hypothetical protein
MSAPRPGSFAKKSGRTAGAISTDLMRGIEVRGIGPSFQNSPGDTSTVVE